MNGWLSVDKPVGWSSFQVVKFVRNILKVKVGHCGTLDPFASGFLLLALGKATKLVERAMLSEKHYTYTIKWGISTDTIDNTGKITSESNVIPEQSQIQAIVPGFIGCIEQVPPMFSAVKVNGVRAYKYARLGKELKLKSKEVKVRSLRITEHKDGLTSFDIVCGKGFYIRSLAYDLGRTLGACCHVIKLRRLTTQAMQNQEMTTLDQKDSLQKIQMYGYICRNILPLDHLLDDITVINLEAKNVKKICNGQVITQSCCDDNPREVLIKHKGAVIALGEACKGFIKPLIILKENHKDVGK